MLHSPAIQIRRIVSLHRPITGAIKRGTAKVAVQDALERGIQQSSFYSKGLLGFAQQPQWHRKQVFPKADAGFAVIEHNA